MAMRQNAVDLAVKYPLAHKAVMESFYVADGLTGADTPEEAVMLHKAVMESFYMDDGLTGADTPEEAEMLHKELQELFCGIRINHKFLNMIPSELWDSQLVHQIPDSQQI